MHFSPHRDYDREQFAENPVPLLLIGTKFDQIPENKRSEVLTRTTFLSEDFNAEEINLVGQHSHLSHCFFKKCIYFTQLSDMEWSDMVLLIKTLWCEKN